VTGSRGLRRSGAQPAARHQNESVPRPKFGECQKAPRTGASLSPAWRRTRSPGEELMTCSISAVAVCCSKVSRVSVMRRAFSIAITACAAKFCKSAISFSENGRTPWRWALMKPCRLASLRSATKSVVRRSVSSRRRAWPRSPAPSFRAAADRRGRRGFRRPPASACRRWGGRGSAPRPRTLPDSQALPRHGNARRHRPPSSRPQPRRAGELCPISSRTPA